MGDASAPGWAWQSERDVIAGDESAVEPDLRRGIKGLSDLGNLMNPGTVLSDA